MAAEKFKVYEKGLLKVLNQSLDFINDTMKAALLVDGYTRDLAAHEFFSDVSANECADPDYAQITLSGKDISIVSNKPRFDFADLDFGNSVTISAKWLIIYKDTGTPSTSPLLLSSDLNSGGGNLSSVNSDFDVSLNAAGAYEITPNV